MLKAILGRILKGQSGFTLIELLAVMGIVAVLAAIVSTSVVGTGETSRDTSVKQDAGTVNTTASTYFGDRTVETLTTETDELVTTINSAGIKTGGTEQTKSSLWPETFITANTNASGSVYWHEFSDATTPEVKNVTLTLSDSDSTALTEATLLGGYTAVDFSTMIDAGYMDKAPTGTDTKEEVTTNVKVFTYLWLFVKDTSAFAAEESETNDARVVQVFKLKSASTSNSQVSLVYAQIF